MALALALLVAAVGTIVGCSDGGGDRSDSTSTDAPTKPAGARGNAAVARDAFLAGFPLVTTMRTMQTFAPIVGVNRLFVGKGLANPTSRLVVAPNRDTVYALAVLDLRAGPMVLTLPDIPGRYHVFQFIDAWMGNFGLVGTRTTGGRAGSWVIVPPGSDVAVPDGFHRLESPTDQAFMLGRIRAVDDADAATASAIGGRARLQPLDPSTATAAPAIARAPGSPQTVGENGIAFFDELGDALAVNPPTNAVQRDAIEAAARLGVGPGRHPSAEQSGDNAATLRAAVADGGRELAHQSGAGGTRVNGWDVNLHIGDTERKDGLLEQALTARNYWGPVTTAEAVYPRATVGADGRPLDGSKRYRIHFAEDELPPVDAFWSVTVYGPDMFPVVNPANRYSLSGDTPGLVTNADGSIDLYLSHDAPAGRRAANWLPVPEGPFNLILRLYLPRAPIRRGTYEYPPVMVDGRARS
jgi:hypothetical protein